MRRSKPKALKPAHLAAVKARAASFAAAKRLNAFFDGRHDVTIPGLLKRIEQCEQAMGMYASELRARIDASERRVFDRVAGETAVVRELTGALKDATRVPRDISTSFAEAQVAARTRNKILKSGKRRRRRARP